MDENAIDGWFKFIKVLDLNNCYKDIVLQKSNTFSLSHLGTVNNINKLSIYQSNNLIIDVNIQDLEDRYKNTIHKKISK